MLCTYLLFVYQVVKTKPSYTNTNNDLNVQSCHVLLVN